MFHTYATRQDKQIMLWFLMRPIDIAEDKYWKIWQIFHGAYKPAVKCVQTQRISFFFDEK